MTTGADCCWNVVCSGGTSWSVRAGSRQGRTLARATLRLVGARPGLAHRSSRRRAWRRAAEVSGGAGSGQRAGCNAAEYVKVTPTFTVRWKRTCRRGEGVDECETDGGFGDMSMQQTLVSSWRQCCLWTLGCSRRRRRPLGDASALYVSSLHMYACTHHLHGGTFIEACPWQA